MSGNLQRAIAAIRSGDKATGKRLLAQVLQAEPNNQTAWLWMSAVVDTGKERAQCLEQVLEINPHNETAQRGLEALRQKQTTPPQAQVQPEASQIKIEFGFSTSPNYQRAVAIAQELSGYTTWGEGRKLRHQVTFVAEEVEEFLHLSGLARKWKSTTFWLNEKELAPPTPNYAS